MKCLLGLSKNCNGFPLISPQSPVDENFGFGIVAFSIENHAALIFKNMHSGKEPFAELYTDKAHGSATFVGCSEELVSPDESAIQPFTHHYAGRDWVLTCVADLPENFKTLLPIDPHSIFTPAGTRDEEYLLCWLLHQIHTWNASSLEELTYQVLYELVREINAVGSIDLLLCDGRNLVAYHDSADKAPLYMLYAIPPHKQTEFDFGQVKVSFDHHDLHQTLTIFTNQSPTFGQENFLQMAPGQMVVVRHSEFLWDSLQQGGCDHAAEEHAQNCIDTPKITPSNPLVLQHISTIPLLSLVGKKHSIFARASIVTDAIDPKPTFYSIVHESCYFYESPVNISKHLFRLQPVHDMTQSILDYKLISSVNGAFYNFTGVFGNAATRFAISEPYTELILKSHSLVANLGPSVDLVELSHQQWRLPLSWMPWDHSMLQAYLMPPELPESELQELCDYAMSFVQRNNNCLLSILDDLNHTIHRDYTYLSGSTNLSTTPYDVYVTRQGVCQDFANLFICLARLLNIPSRYRVGYIYTGGEYENVEQGDATHAWVEVYLPGTGWMGFDPTNACHDGKNHIRVATGRSYLDATPTSGTIYSGGGHETLTTMVKMIRLSPEEVDEIMMKRKM